MENRLHEGLEGFFYAVSMEEGAVAGNKTYFHARFNRTDPVG